MEKPGAIAAKIWIGTNLYTSLGITIFLAIAQEMTGLIIFPFIILGCLFISLPVLVILYFLLPLIVRGETTFHARWYRLIVLLIACCIGYGLLPCLVCFGLSEFSDALTYGFTFSLCLIAATTLSVLSHRKAISAWISSDSHKQYNGISRSKSHKLPETLSQIFILNIPFHTSKKPLLMSEIQPANEMSNPQNEYLPSPANSNKILVKAAITAALILAMLIPQSFIENLIREREHRQTEVTKEVSSKWALPQTISTPYLCIPYNQRVKDEKGNVELSRNYYYQAANMLNVTANIDPQVRKRSIYEVLLYKSNVAIKGAITLNPPKEISVEDLLLNEARLCIGVTDFKGIEEQITVNFDGGPYDFEPGLPASGIDKSGLSAPIRLNSEAAGKTLPFDMTIKLKGTDQLHFLPLSDNSNFEINSSWPSPSFDGSSLPRERNVTTKGFTANWGFNKANLAVMPQLLNTNTSKESLAFGITMVQPADQYAKTNRSVKYAILVVGLIFSMFFIIELLQKKNVHPVQYLLIGLALIIFYTLLLSIGEFIGFNSAYAIAACATVILIGIYAKSLFQSYRTAALLSCFMGMLYGFIYILIQLEDTALLAGSIGLFLLLSVAMYFSRKINWYNTPAQQTLYTA